MSPEEIDALQRRCDFILDSLSDLAGVVSVGFGASNSVHVSALEESIADVEQALRERGLSGVAVRPAPKFEGLRG